MVRGRSTRATANTPPPEKQPAERERGRVAVRSPRATRADRDPTPDRQSRIEEKIARARHPSGSGQQAAHADLAVPWSATLTAPTSAVRHDSTQPVAVQVTAPAVLAGQTVKVGAEPRAGTPNRRRGARWQTATWQDAPAQQRTAAATLGRGDLRLPAGIWRITINIDGVVLNAGQIIIT